MDALELADELKKSASWSPDWNVLEQAATMLRQQQAEIEKLKAEKIRAYDNGYEDGRKLDTNPKPAKTLTDEEIEECFEESCTDFKLLENEKTKGVVNIIDVGRAILRKANEK